MRAMSRGGIVGRIFGARPFGRKAAPPPPEPPAPAEPAENPHADLERAARGFVEEHRPLLDRGDPEVLERVYVEGANVFTAINPEVVAAANRAAAAKRAVAAAIRDPHTSATRMQEIKDEEASASAAWASLESASGELDGFLARVRERMP